MPISLSFARPGRYRFVGVWGGGRGVWMRLQSLGIMPGDIIEVIKSSPGPVVIAKGNARIGLGVGMARKILVEPVR